MDTGKDINPGLPKDKNARSKAWANNLGVGKKIAGEGLKAVDY